MQESFCCLCHSYHALHLGSEIYHAGDYRFAGFACQEAYAAEHRVQADATPPTDSNSSDQAA